MSLINGFLEQCHLNPSHPALIQNDRSCSYDKLKIQSQAVAVELSTLGIKSQERIAIALDRGIDATIAIFGVLLSGGCYLPLDLKNPPERLNYIINDAGVNAIIGLGHYPEWLEQGKRWIDIAKLSSRNDQVLPFPRNPENHAAILYTSGSSGLPKGVVLSHRAIAAFADWAGETFRIGAEDRIASIAPFHFDLSTFDLFSTLRFGGSIHFVPIQLALAPSKLTAWLGEYRITCIYTVPSLLNFLALKGNLNAHSLTDLRLVLFAGEVFPTGRLILLAEKLPRVRLFNLYGPTETNVCCYWPVDRSRLDPEQPIPIGIPASQAQLRIDQNSGELLVKGQITFSGYWQNGMLKKIVDKDGWYATGDRVSLGYSGEYFYYGRIDRMIKCSGYRVEPAEIEAAIDTVNGVIASAVVGIDNPASGQRPVAAIILQPTLELAELNKQLRQKLPSYMQPTRYRVLNELPRLSSGKVDYEGIRRLFN